MANDQKDQVIGLIKAVYRCELIPEDFLFFVSYEFNTFTQMQPVIHNYALTYALAKQFNTGFLGTSPRYEELYKFENYATPARPLTDPKFVTHTYNSVCSRTNLTQSSFNIPSLGRNRKVTPYSTKFEFLVFSTGERMPPYIRIGKKSCIAQVKATRLKLVGKIDDPEDLIDVNFFFNVLDLSPSDIIESADIVLMFPSPIARRMTVKAPYYVLEDDGTELFVPMPKHLRGNLNE